MSTILPWLFTLIHPKNTKRFFTDQEERHVPEQRELSSPW
jgi:hypothetical protein